MTWLSAILNVVHLVGLALGVGGATVKLALLFKCRNDLALVPIFLKVARPITRQIILGLVFLALSGIGWLILGYDWRPLLVAKLVLVAAIFVLGPVIDNVAEPRFRAAAPGPGEAPSPAFAVALKQYLALEFVATLLFYVVIVGWVLLS